MQATLITGVVGLVLALGLAYKWKSEQVKVARLQGELSQSIANTENLKTPALKFLVQDFQVFVLRRVAALRRRIDDEQDLPLVIG